jgi:class 3 adenylate cyclase
LEAERRQRSRSVDMVGFTTFSERSGEEAAFTLMRSLSKLMDDAVREHGGIVQSFTGDGIMAVFGAPVAFEDAPLRACRAALSIPTWSSALPKSDSRKTCFPKGPHSKSHT